MSNIINKVVYGGNTLIDLTGDTVTASDVMSGVTVHLADGTKVSGTMTATSTPTADTIAKFDNDAHMNSEDMSAQDVSDFVSGLNISGINAVDYIVAQGTSGIWTYRKWNSGIAECWGVSTATGAYSAWGSIYSYDFGQVAYPSGLFISTPLCVMQGYSNSGASITSIRDASGDKDYTPKGTFIRGTTSSAETFVMQIYAKGWWK